MGEYRQLSDEELAAVAGGAPLPSGVSLADVAHDFHRLRKVMRGETRRSEQLRKLRWSIENATRDFETKSELVLEKVRTALAGEAKVQEAEAAIVERIAEWLESGGRGSDELARMVREGRWR